VSIAGDTYEVYTYELVQILAAASGWVANFRSADGEARSEPVVMWALAAVTEVTRQRGRPGTVPVIVGSVSLGKQVVGLVMDDELGLVVADVVAGGGYSRAEKSAP
jgi:hypothetical protein